MDNQYFNYQLNRIKDVFGSYKSSQEYLLFEKLKHVSDIVFEQAVDELILNSRSKPLLVDFVKTIDKIKRVRPSDNEDTIFFDTEYKSIFSSEEIREHVKMFDLAFEGSISRAELREYTNEIRKFLKKHQNEWQSYDTANWTNVINSSYRCSTCLDSGLVFAEDEEHREFIFRCFCEKGQREIRAFPVWGKQYASKYKWLSDISKTDTCDC